MPVIVRALIALNGFAIFLYGRDKWKARHGRWRIPEATLLLVALCGGSVGALMGMYLFRHKTRKPRFRYGIPAILALQLALYALFHFHLISL